MKRVTIYDLYSGPRGPSCQSQWYGRFSKTITQVAAVSVRQAIFLAARGDWSTGPGVAGIVAEATDNLWTYADGTTTWVKRFNHRQVYK